MGSYDKCMCVPDNHIHGCWIHTEHEKYPQKISMNTTYVWRCGKKIASIQMPSDKHYDIQTNPVAKEKFMLDVNAKLGSSDHEHDFSEIHDFYNIHVYFQDCVRGV